ncbi:BamA/TamA family outer membrane protein [Rudanella lutea]|uniref:BamA/TamA family outer membrane protein n=1 Tax=Rudanella lutea TaxID=451374 RepID=UPI00037DF189|nr:BamA/TamA family outer membrane protein [Rudanella lutea]
MIPRPLRCSFRIFLFLLWLTVVGTQANAQVVKPHTLLGRYLGKFTNDTTAPEKPRFLVYPTATYAPETSLELGVSTLYLYHARGDYKANRLSEINAFTFVTLRGQYGFNIDNALYGHRDRWLFIGRTRLQRFPLLYYGIGPEASPAAPATVDALSIQVRQRALKGIGKNLFAGLQVDYQALSRVSFEQPDRNPFPLPTGARGSANLGLGAGVVYDSRKNALNARRGFFGELAYLDYNPAWGSTFRFQNTNFDLRYYRTINATQVLAWQGFGQFMSGTVPFNQLALLGSETIMRGYYPGRFRDRAYVATQLEYRFLPFPFSKRLGGAVFASVGTVAPTPAQLDVRKLLPAGGAGLRYFLFPKKDIFLRFDVGFTREGPGFYVFTGEAF